MTPPLRLNHLYRVVDRETFAAIRDSSWLREVFAPSELRTTTRPDWQYTGLYWYGRHTYVEVFEEGAQGAAGASGLAFAVETPGGAADTADAWRASLGQASHRVVVRPTDAGPVPWFHIAHAVPDERDALKLWAMEYDPSFLLRWHPARTPATGITRDAVLERYAAVAAHQARAPLLDDIVAATLALGPVARQFLERHLSAFDTVVRDVGDDATYVDGDDFVLGISSAGTERRGLQDLVCRLRRAVGRETIGIGSTTLIVDGDRLVWKFRD